MIFKIKNVKFIIGFPFFAVITYLLSTDLGVNVLIAVLFSTLHEIGHMVLMICFGVKPEKIVIGAMGIRIQKNLKGLSYKEECVVAISGPLVNLFFAVLFFVLDKNSLFFSINAGLFLVNILPVKILDGGRLLYNFIHFKFSEETADKVLRISESITAIILIMILGASLIFNYVNASFVFFTIGLSVIIILSFLFPEKLTEI